MSNPTDIEVAGVPAWMSNEQIAAPSSLNNNNNNNNNNNGDVLPDWSIDNNNNNSNYDGPVAIGVPVLVHQEISTNAPPTTNTTTTTTTAINTNANTSTGTSTNAEIASQKTWNEYFRESFTRDGRLLIITLLIIICMNIPIIKWILYPFTIFSTWIHELCHGLAAIFTGGSISKIMIYPDTSGLAYTSANPNRRGFIASAGYQGTAIIGCLLLLFRRTKRGPRTGTMIIALMMIVSACLWIRNIFGFIFIFIFGIILVGSAWKLPSTYIKNLYIILAVTCSLNAITSVNALFGSNTMVNGTISSTDAHTMSDVVGGSYILWAILWLFLAIICTLIGILFAIPGPDEVADFTCCGICQDYGCFKLCNYPGQRCTKRMFGGSRDDDTSTNTVTATTTTTTGP
jgi:hypothetical protein